MAATITLSYRNKDPSQKNYSQNHQDPFNKGGPYLRRQSKPVRCDHHPSIGISLRNKVVRHHFTLASKQAVTILQNRPYNPKTSPRPRNQHSTKYIPDRLCASKDKKKKHIKQNIHPPPPSLSLALCFVVHQALGHNNCKRHLHFSVRHHSVRIIGKSIEPRLQQRAGSVPMEQPHAHAVGEAALTDLLGSGSLRYSGTRIKPWISLATCSLG